MGLVVVLGLAAGAAWLATSPGDLVRSTRVQSATSVVLVDAAGLEHTAHPGQLLDPGWQVRTGAGDGSAVLVTGSRRVVLGPAAAVTLQDAGHCTLLRGALVVDRRSGAPLSVRAGPVTVDTERGAVRVERGFAVRVAAYRTGGGLVRTDSGALHVAALQEAEVAGGALPRAPRPLRLRDDLDRQADLGLAELDRALVGLAAQVDADTASPVVLRAGPGAPPSEVALAAAIALAAHRPVSAAALPRQDEASWGVVAAMLHVDAAAVARALQTLPAPPDSLLGLAASSPISPGLLLLPTTLGRSGPGADAGASAAPSPRVRVPDGASAAAGGAGETAGAGTASRPLPVALGLDPPTGRPVPIPPTTALRPQPRPVLRVATPPSVVAPVVVALVPPAPTAQAPLPVPQPMPSAQVALAPVLRPRPAPLRSGPPDRLSPPLQIPLPASPVAAPVLPPGPRPPSIPPPAPLPIPLPVPLAAPLAPLQVPVGGPPQDPTGARLGPPTGGSGTAGR